MEDERGFNTRAIHSDDIGQMWPGNPAIVGISLSTTFKQQSPGVTYGYEYSRSDNPTRNSLEKTLAHLENAKYALTYASGLAAEALILHLLQSGDEVLCIDDVYGGTNRLFNKVYNAFKLEFKMIDMTNSEVLKKSISDKTKVIITWTQMVWLETPTNPTLKITDIMGVRKILDGVKHKIIFVVDNTFMTPYFQKPLNFGADITINSVTKYINGKLQRLSGHSDVVMGSLTLNDDELYEKLKYRQNAVGAIPGVFDCYLVLRGIRTLGLRMERHQSNALKIANHFKNHPKVKHIIYPGLESHPQYKIGKKQTTGFSGILSMILNATADETRMFLENLKIFSIAESLGGFESLVEIPSIMTHASVPVEQREALGISDSLIRFSIGLEDADDLIKDIEEALKCF